MKVRKNRYIAGAALILAVGTFILFVFSLLGRTEMRALYLLDTDGERFGWRYELLADGHVQAYEPVFADDGVTLLLPGEMEAVRITRTMTEDILGAQLQWNSYSYAVEVRLDGALLHSDFPEIPRGGDGFLHPDAEDWARLLRDQSSGRTQVQMSLPANYTGKELSVTTYFPEDSLLPKKPEYPYLGSADSYMAQFVVSSFTEYAAAVFYAILTVLTAGIFLLDIYNNDADDRTLLLCLYFALLFLNYIYDSPAGYYSALGSWVNLNFLYGIYIAPLYLYLSLRLKKWWKYPLCAGITVWVLYECARRFLNIRRGLIVNYGYTGKALFLLILALAAALCAERFARDARRRWNRSSLFVCGCAAVTTATYLLNKIRSFGNAREYFLNGLLAPLRVENYEPVVNAITDITAYMTLIIVVAEVVRRTLRTRRTMDVLRERERQSIENYHHLLSAQEATNALRHEMRHHFNALKGILDSGDVQRASSYVASVAGEFETLPEGYYSQNMLVNAIAGTYLEHARALGIRTEHRLALPTELAIEDTDLSVFLSNLLQNALEACQRMSPEADRYIRIEMHLRKNFLFIKCVNSREEAAVPAPPDNRAEHGYGLAAMRRVAEKYGSVLLTEASEKEFEVRSCFCLKAAPQEGDNGRQP